MGITWIFHVRNHQLNNYEAGHRSGSELYCVQLTWKTVDKPLGNRLNARMCDSQVIAP